MSKGKRVNLERLLCSAWERQHSRVRSEVPKTKSTASHRPTPLEYTILRMGVPLAIVAFGYWLMTANHFFFGVTLFYLGLALFAFDLAYDRFFTRWPSSIRTIVGIAYLVSIVVASDKWIFVAAPIEVFASSGVPNYGPGSTISGIEWQPQYSDLNFYIKNPTNTDYDNFDVEITTDIVIKQMLQVRGLNDCKIAGVHQAEYVHWQSSIQGHPVGPADNPASDYHVVPLDKYGKPIVPDSGGADWTYRIRCEKLPANSQSDFFAALEVVNEPLSQFLYGSPRAASWVEVKAVFQTSGRNREKEMQRCSIGEICKEK